MRSASRRLPSSSSRAAEPDSPLAPGVAVSGSFKKAGFTNAWREHPFEWVEGKRMGVLREYTEGVFRWMASTTELQPRADGGTTLVHQVRLVPANVLGRMVAAVEVGFKGRRRVESVYRRIDAYVTRDRDSAPLADAFEPPPALRGRDQQRIRDGAERLIARDVDLTTVGLLADFLVQAGDQEVARMRPLALAQRLGLSPDDVVTACLLAAHEGLLVLLWDILCPVCRIPSAIEATLRNIKSHGACRACNLDFALDFANSVEMIFRVHPSVRPSEPATYCIGGPAHSPHVVAQVRVAPGERLELVLELSEGPYSLRGPQLPYTVALRVHPDTGAVRGELDLVRGPGPELPRTFRAGTQTLRLTNPHTSEVVVRVERTARREDALTAARASAHPLFRELFPFEVLEGNQLVSIAHITLLATRLENAAGLYRELGDVRAFGLIHEHFRLAEEQIRREGGALLKTVNEGLLATFDDPAAAVRVALALQPLLAKRIEARALRIAVAVHRGPAMVATINGRLDYFGNTVQQTVRLCQQAAGGEVRLTQPLAADPHVQGLLHTGRLACEVLSPSEPADALPYRVVASPHTANPA